MSCDQQFRCFKGTSESSTSALCGHVLQSNSSLQYRLYVPHHVPRLISLYSLETLSYILRNLYHTCTQTHGQTHADAHTRARTE